jgi:hypothetical protein
MNMQPGIGRISYEYINPLPCDLLDVNGKFFELAFEKR